MNRNRVYILFFTVLLCLSGCQKTPDNEVVVGKDAEKMEAALQETRNIPTEGAAESEFNNSFSNQPERYRESVLEEDMASSDAKVKLDIDASVKEIVGKIPVYQISTASITAEEARRWADYFFQGSTAYEHTVEKTKAEIEVYLLRLKELYSEERLQRDYGNDPELLERVREEGKERIAFYEAKHAAAPETIVPQEASWEFYPETHYRFEGELEERTSSDSNLGKLKELWVEAEVDGFTSTVYAANREESDFQIHSISYSVENREAYKIGTLSTDPEAAEQVVRDALMELGLSDWEIVLGREHENPEGICYHQFFCCKSYDGIVATLLPQLSTIKGEGDYAARYYYEMMECQVSNGKILYMSIYGNTGNKRLVNDNVATLSFEEIMDRFRTQMEVQYAADSSEDSAERNRQQHIYIEKIEEGMVRVKVPNQEYEYYMVPAWSFYGTFQGEIPDREEAEPTPLVTINAIDGSIINTELGY